MTFPGDTLSRSLLGLKRTLVCAVQMSAFDPKRTYVAARTLAIYGRRLSGQPRGGDEVVLVLPIVRPISSVPIELL